MHALATGTVFDTGPLPTIHHRYKSLASSPRGRLSARADAVGTLHLSFRARDAQGRERAMDDWRAGPLRSCAMMIDALCDGLRLLGEDISLERVLRLARRVDRHIARRLAQYVALREGRYEQLASSVELVCDPSSPAPQPLPRFIGWLVACSTGLRQQPTDAADAENDAFRRACSLRESFLILRRNRLWQLWTRLERADCGSMPSRQHALLCQTELDLDEPALIAELMLYVLLRERGCARGAIAATSSGLIPQARMELLESGLPCVA